MFKFSKASVEKIEEIKRKFNDVPNIANLTFFEPKFEETNGQTFTNIYSGFSNLMKNYSFSTTKEEIINNPDNNYKQIVEEALKKALEKTKEKYQSFNNEEAAKCIDFAIKNGGLSNNIENLKKTLENKESEINSYILFSSLFQKEVKKSELFTGNQNATKLVGMRLKRLTPDYIQRMRDNFLGVNEEINQESLVKNHIANQVEGPKIKKSGIDGLFSGQSDEFKFFNQDPGNVLNFGNIHNKNNELDKVSGSESLETKETDPETAKRNDQYQSSSDLNFAEISANREQDLDCQANPINGNSNQVNKSKQALQDVNNYNQVVASKEKSELEFEANNPMNRDQHADLSIASDGETSTVDLNKRDDPPAVYLRFGTIYDDTKPDLDRTLENNLKKKPTNTIKDRSNASLESDSKFTHNPLLDENFGRLDEFYTPKSETDLSETIDSSDTTTKIKDNVSYGDAFSIDETVIGGNPMNTKTKTTETSSGGKFGLKQTLKTLSETKSYTKLTAENLKQNQQAISRQNLLEKNNDPKIYEKMSEASHEPKTTPLKAIASRLSSFKNRLFGQ